MIILDTWILTVAAYSKAEIGMKWGIHGTMRWEAMLSKPSDFADLLGEQV